MHLKAIRSTSNLLWGTSMVCVSFLSLNKYSLSTKSSWLHSTEKSSKTLTLANSVCSDVIVAISWLMCSSWSLCMLREVLSMAVTSCETDLVQAADYLLSQKALLLRYSSWLSNLSKGFLFRCLIFILSDSLKT